MTTTQTNPNETTHHIRIHARNAGVIAAIIAIAVAASFITSTAIAGRSFVKRTQQQHAESRTISVTGYARKRISADQGEWRITLSGRGNTLAETYAVLDNAVTSARDFLTNRGFAPTELDFLPITTTTRMIRNDKGQETDDIAGYTLRQTVVVRTPYVERIATSAGAVTSLIEQNIQIESRAPEYTVSDLDQIKIDIAGLASADARKRADTVAAEAGSKITDVRDARLGVIQITQPDSTEVRSYGMYDTATIDKDIAVTVTLRLGIEPSR